MYKGSRDLFKGQIWVTLLLNTAHRSHASAWHETGLLLEEVRGRVHGDVRGDGEEGLWVRDPAIVHILYKNSLKNLPTVAKSGNKNKVQSANCTLSAVCPRRVRLLTFF